MHDMLHSHKSLPYDKRYSNICIGPLQAAASDLHMPVHDAPQHRVALLVHTLSCHALACNRRAGAPRLCASPCQTHLLAMQTSTDSNSSSKQAQAAASLCCQSRRATPCWSSA